MSLSIIVLAAGKGSRMKSSQPKVLHSLAGKPLLGHVLDTAKDLNPLEVIIVVGHEADKVIKYVDTYSMTTVVQEEQLGTGHAVLQAMTKVNGDTVLVLYGDVPLISAKTVQRVISSTFDGSLCLLSVDLHNPAGYGRILRAPNGDPIAIREEKDASYEEKQIKESNTGILAGPKELLEGYLSQLTCGNAQGEYYLTDVVGLSVNSGVKVEAVCVSDPLEVEGINSRSQLEVMERKFQLKRADQLMESGVTIIDRSRIDIRGSMSCGEDTIIDVNCIFKGDVTIGARVEIGPNCFITDSRIADDAKIMANSVLEGASVGENASVGPFARLRPGAVLGPFSKVGNFVEIKKSIIGEGSKVSHLSYIGDAELGMDVNVGAGAITCNYDGVNKSKTIIGDRSFIGSNTALVAPIVIGKGATIGAGSVLAKNAPDEQLTLTRSKQITMPAWKRPVKKGN